MHRVWSVNAVSRLAALLLFFGFSCEASVGFTRRQARVVERAQSSPAAREHQQPEFATSASGLEAELRSRSRWEQDGQQFALGPRRIRFANGIHHAENRLTFPVSRLIGGHGSASSGPTQGGGAQLIVTKRSSLLGEVVTLMSKNANEDTAEIYRKTESASTPTPLNAIPLPDADDATAFRNRLSSRCASRIAKAGPGIRRPPPSRIAVFGLPNTGTDSLARYLDAYLKVNVTEGLARQGKHLMPFHPDFEDLLSAGCEADDDWTAVILTVRNPLAWFLDQTSDTEYQGHTCLPGDGEEICYFDSGFNGVSATARNTSEPARWEFPTLLDLWSAYADYLPLSLNTVMVVRYEDMMQDRESVRASVAQYFGADIKSAAFFQPDPMEDYLFDGTYNPDGLHSKLQHFETFECFWLQFGLHPSSKGARDQGIMPPKTVIDCVFQDEEHYIVYPEKMQPLSSAMERGIMQKAIQTHDYEIPSLAKIQQAWDACGLDIEAYHQDEFEDDEEDQEK